MEPPDPSELSEGMRHAHGPHPQVFRGAEGTELTGYLPSWHGSNIHELANGLRLGTVVC
jgi:hypothetical protein